MITFSLHQSFLFIQWDASHKDVHGHSKAMFLSQLRILKVDTLTLIECRKTQTSLWFCAGHWWDRTRGRNKEKGTTEKEKLNEQGAYSCWWYFFPMACVDIESWSHFSGPLICQNSFVSIDTQLYNTIKIQTVFLLFQTLKLALDF